MQKTFELPIKTLVEYWYKDFEFEKGKEPILWDYYLDPIKGKVIFVFTHKDSDNVKTTNEVEDE